MKLLKYIGALLVATALLFLLAGKFSTVETRFKCIGQMSNGRDSQSATAFIKLGEFRWWVGLWSDSDASLDLEIPHKAFEYFGHLVAAGDLYEIYDFNKKLKGNFSTLSNALSLSTNQGFFEGICTKTPQ